MKNKGFTLIELLAVIVVLAVVALIAFPIIAGIIEKTKRSAAFRSVEGYVEAANNAAVLYDIDNNKGINVTESKHTFTSNVDTEDFSKIKAKGTLPTYSYLDFDINKKVVTEGHFCINGYSVLYSEGAAKASETKYCEEDNTGNNGSGSNSGGNNQNGGSYAGNVRWNPETKYYEVLYDGTWYQDRYFDPLWDGYIYNNGQYEQEYIGTWTAETNGGWTYGKAGRVDYAGLSVMRLYQVWYTQTNQDYQGVSEKFKRTEYIPKGYDNVYIEVGSISTNTTSPYKASYGSGTARVMKGSTVIASHAITANSSFSLDISPYKEDNLTLEFIVNFGGPYVGGSPSTAYDGIVEIKTIRMLNND